jgi:RHS repeat-associated protein
LSSLYDFPARRQSPSQGRWISPDPLGVGAVAITNPQSWNRYVYVLSNPLALIDPLGLEPPQNSCPDNDESGDCDGDGGGTGGDPDCTYGYSDSGVTENCPAPPCDASMQSCPTNGPTNTSTNGGGSGGGGAGAGAGSNGGGTNTAKNANNCINPNAAQRALINALGKVANWTNSTIGFGVGGSYGLGFGLGFGFSGTGSAQIQVSPGGSASLVYTWGGSGITQDWLTPSSFGASAVVGVQISVSSGPPSSGPGADVALSGVYPVRGPYGPGGSLDVDGSVDDGVTGTLTGGGGAGAVSGSAVVTQTAVVPFCKGG